MAKGTIEKISMDRVNFFYFVMTIGFGAVFSILIWLPQILGDTFYGNEYTPRQFATVSLNLTLLMAIACLCMILMTVWNTWQLALRSQTPKTSGGGLHHGINFLIFMLEAIILTIIFAITQKGIVQNLHLTAFLPLLYAAAFWILCALWLKPGRRN